MAETKKRLGDLLVEAGLIDQFQLRSALAEQQKWGGRLGNHFVRLKFITEEKLVRFLSQQLKIQYVDINKTKIAPAVIEIIPEEIATKHNILPLGIKTEGGKKLLFIATSDPTNLDAIDEIQFLTGYTVKPIIASDTAIANAIKIYYNPVPQEPLSEQSIPLDNINVVQETEPTTPEPTQSSKDESKDEMIIVRDEPGGSRQPEEITEAELPEEAKAILHSTLGIKTGLSPELLTFLMNKETREILNMLIELLIDKGILKESDIKQHVK